LNCCAACGKPLNPAVDILDKAGELCAFCWLDAYRLKLDRELPEIRKTLMKRVQEALAAVQDMPKHLYSKRGRRANDDLAMRAKVVNDKNHNWPKTAEIVTPDVVREVGRKKAGERLRSLVNRQKKRRRTRTN